MASRKLIRLTESDLHRIIEDTVKRVIMEETEPDLEALKDAVKKAKKGSPKWLEAVRAYQKAKERAGATKVVTNPDIDYSQKENEKRGTTKTNIDRLFRTKGNMTMKRELDKETIRKAKERQQQQRNEFGDF